MVDGVGIYPNQEDELSIKDIYKQYDYFFSLLDGLPDGVDVILIPGNHVGVRRGEPQPAIPKEYVKERDGVYLRGSPTWFSIHGVKFLMYHGTSIDSYIASVSDLSYAKPEDVVVEMLIRRHLSPMYGKNLIVPEAKDYLVVDEVPDVVHMGHVHKNGITEYRGVLVVSSGTWQDWTDYQKMQGHIPTPGIATVYNMKKGSVTTLDFVGANYG